MPINIWGEFVPVDPSGCRYCGFSSETHYSQWAPLPTGWHTHVPPTKEQRYERIRANARDRKAVRAEEM